MKKDALFGPDAYEYMGSETFKDKFGAPVVSKLTINNQPVVISSMLSEEGLIGIVEIGQTHIGVYYDDGRGFVFTYTKDIEPYKQYKTQIEAEAKRIITENPPPSLKQGIV